MTRTRTLPLFLTIFSIVVPAVIARAAPLPPRNEVLGIIQRSASAEIELQKEMAANPSLRGHVIGNTWVSAAFFVGATKLAEAVDAPDILDFCLQSAAKQNYAFRGGWAPVHLINADDIAIGDLYQTVFLRTGWMGALLPLKQRLDYTVPYLKFEPQSDRLTWWWCDALFMAPPIFARMSQITGDSRYIDAMDTQWWRTHARIYDKEEHLFARDARFKDRRSENGKKIFWARGEGWVLAGTCRVLELMPANYPSRARYIELFQEMAARIASLQHADGLWRASLLDPEAYPEAETSGSAFFVYALGFGINHGLLERDAYLPHVVKGWEGLNRYVLPNGILGQVQTTGDQPVSTKRNSTALYASGAFILAGLEVANLAEQPKVLPLLPKQAPQLKYDAANWSSRKLAATPTPEQLKDYERNEAERRTVTDQSFDPVIDDPNYTSPIPHRGGEPSAKPSGAELPSRAEVLAKMQSVNAYFMEEWPDVSKPIKTDITRPSNIWTRGVYYEGLMELWRLNQDVHLLDYAVRWGDAHKWSLRNFKMPNGRTTHNADDQCAGQTYIELWQIDQRTERIRDIKANIDATVARSHHADWWWVDALQMAMPVYAKLGAIVGGTDGEKYFDKMHALYLNAKNEQGGDGLFNPADGLWWRDPAFTPPYKTPNAKHCYWSRGNGWVVAALIRTLDVLPDKSPYRKEYITMLKTMCEALRKVQRPDGFWNVSLHDAGDFGGKETTGTALFVAGMAWGVRQGILDRTVYEPVITRAWSAMAKDSVHSNGFLGYVQGTGKEPKDGQPVTYNSKPDFEDYGVGCFLLAGAEVCKLIDARPAMRAANSSRHAAK